ncbi:MAG TPA: single-stranded DNA-binding protein [Acetobacteraceae bacterium]
MAGSVNKVILIGNLGRDPESRSLQSGGKVVTFSIATSETWSDRASGERKERTQWHRIVIYNERIAEIAEKYVRKGSKIYIEGALETRKYTDKDGNERETSEVVLRNFRGELTMLDGRPGAEGGMSEGGGYQPRERAAPTARGPAQRSSGGPSWDAPKGGADLDDEIPF